MAAVIASDKHCGLAKRQSGKTLLSAGYCLWVLTFEKEPCFVGYYGKETWFQNFKVIFKDLQMLVPYYFPSCEKDKSIKKITGLDSVRGRDKIKFVLNDEWATSPIDWTMCDFLRIGKIPIKGFTTGPNG